MIKLSASEILPKVNTRKEFIDQLTNMIIPPKEEIEDEEMRGRMRELKTYIIESNADFPQELKLDGFYAKLGSTGMDDLKILNVFRNSDFVASFYVDLSDSRFITIYTNAKVEHTHDFQKSLVRAHDYMCDYTWFSSTMLDKIAKSFGNSFEGLGVDYEDIFGPKDFPTEPSKKYTLDISGGDYAKRTLTKIMVDEEIQRLIAYNKVRVIRGTKTSPLDYVQDDITFQGVFSVKSGKSVTEHISLVDMVKSDYKKQMKLIEDNSIGTRKIDGTMRIEGKAFDVEFKRSIPDWDTFLNKMFDSAGPFRLWGLKEKIYDGYTRVLAVDLHTGHPLDLEMTDGLIRVYLPQGSCGNTVLRLFVNLQQYFDSTIRCDELM